MAEDRLRLIINDRCLRHARTGVGHYVAELLAALPGADPGLEVVPFYQSLARLRAPIPASGRPARLSHTPAARAGDGCRWLMQGAYELAFEAYGTWTRCRLYHEPNHIPGPWQGPVITTIHDLSVLLHPQWHPVDRVRWYERDFVASLPRSEHFIAVSEFTRREILDHLHLQPGRVSVIYPGVRHVFHPRPDDEIRLWLAQRRLQPDYLLFVGTMEPRKNISGLLAAYAGLPHALRERHPLLLAGMSGWGDLRVEDPIREHDLSGQVRVLGYVSDEELARLYGGARALVWPSFYEGFGLPVLECMATGTPVIAARAAALPEVVGDAGLLVDPRNAGGWTQAMSSLIHDRDLAGRLARAGLQRSRHFTWQECAARHAALYRRFAAA